ncbi:hypothetical protein GCM10023405_32440 [Streptomonospora salina]
MEETQPASSQLSELLSRTPITEETYKRRERALAKLSQLLSDTATSASRVDAPQHGTGGNR